MVNQEKHLMHLHVSRERGQRLVEVIHLSQDTDCCQDQEDVSRRMAKLVIASKGELEGDSKGLDRHDGNGADCRAYGQVDKRIFLAVKRRNSVYHDDGKCDDGNGV